MGEVHADRRLDELGFAARHEVQLHDEIASWLQSPRKTGRQERSGLPGCPPEKVAVRIYGRAENDAVVTGRHILLVEGARRGRCIDADVRVMDPRVVRAELDALHVLAPFDR